MEFDTIVVGVGGMGSAVADALAGRGQRVLALEQFGIAHARGSSHGRTRIVRQAYFESPDYLPLLRRAYELWATVPPDAGLRVVGCLSLGRADSAVVTGAARSAATWDVPLEELTRPEVLRRFPQFRPGADEVAVFEPYAGFVRPEETVGFFASRAAARGAELRTGQRVLDWEATGSGVRVRTEQGEYTAAHLVLAAGAWTPAVAAGLGLPIHIERRVMHFFAPTDPALFAPERMPTFIWDLAADDAIYGFPRDGADGVKIGFHHRGGRADPDQPQPVASAAEETEMRAELADRMPGVLGATVRTVGCMYALTPDHNFALGFAPGGNGRAVVAAGFSGHGFKFVPVVGEVVADLVTTGGTAFDLDFLSPSRFAAPADVPGPRP